MHSIQEVIKRDEWGCNGYENKMTKPTELCRKMQVTNQCLEIQWAAQTISSMTNERQSPKSPCNAFSLWF